MRKLERILDKPPDPHHSASLDSAFENNITNTWGEKGQQWLAKLSELKAEIARTHSLSDLKPLQNLSTAYLCTCFQGEQPLILKLSPDEETLERESAALSAFAGFGVPKLFLRGKGFLLQERVLPGVSLRSYFPERDEEALIISGTCLKRLHKAPLPPSHSFPHIREWLAVLNHALEIPGAKLQKARQLRDRLLESSEKEVLLHGDLHHDNILQNAQGWTVIDPKGVIGTPDYEAAAFIRNPMPELLSTKEALRLLHHRILRFSEMLSTPKQRILEWCFVQAVLAWAWALEDRGDVSYFKDLTEIFEAMSTFHDFHF